MKKLLKVKQGAIVSMCLEPKDRPGARVAACRQGENSLLIASQSRPTHFHPVIAPYH